MKHYKLKKLNKREKRFLQEFRINNLCRRMLGWEENSLELKDWFIPVKEVYKGTISRVIVKQGVAVYTQAHPQKLLDEANFRGQKPDLETRQTGRKLKEVEGK